jgi:hypothetical protein
VADTCVENDCYQFDVDFLAESVNDCISAESAQDCQDACKDSKACAEFTWISNANDQDQNCCLIQSRPEGKEHTITGFVSGPKHCGNEEVQPTEPVATTAKPSAPETNAPVETPTTETPKEETPSENSTEPPSTEAPA